LSAFPQAPKLDDQPFVVHAFLKMAQNSGTGGLPSNHLGRAAGGAQPMLWTIA
jgi:hypothetical protein